MKKLALALLPVLAFGMSGFSSISFANEIDQNDKGAFGSEAFLRAERTQLTPHEMFEEELHEALAPLVEAESAQVGERARGMDVSAWQENSWIDDQNDLPSVIDWPKQYNQSARFVYSKATEDHTYRSRFHRDQVKQAKAAGIAAGSYHITEMDLRDTQGGGGPEASADHFVAQSPKWEADGLSLPPIVAPYVMDINCFGYTPVQVIDWFKRFLPIVEEGFGRKPGIFASAAWWNQCTGGTTELNDYDLFIFDPTSDGAVTGEPTLPRAWDTWKTWQHWDNIVSGYNGPKPLFPVDNTCLWCAPVGFQQVFNGSEADLREYALGDVISPPVVDADRSSMSVTRGPREGNGLDAHQVNVSLVDVEDNPMIGLSSDQVQEIVGVRPARSRSPLVFGDFVERADLGAGVYVVDVTSEQSTFDWLTTSLWGLTPHFLRFITFS